MFGFWRRVVDENEAVGAGWYRHLRYGAFPSPAHDVVWCGVVIWNFLSGALGVLRSVCVWIGEVDWLIFLLILFLRVSLLVHDIYGVNFFLRVSFCLFFVFYLSVWLWGWVVGCISALGAAVEKGDGGEELFV